MPTETYGQLEQELQAALVTTLKEGDDLWVYVYDFSDTFVIYRVEGGEFQQDDYTQDGEGKIELAGKPVPVKPITSYEPLSLATGEARGTVTNGHTGLLARSPDEIARRVAEQLHKLSSASTSSELVYSPSSRRSYYRDLIVVEQHLSGERSARERLEHHAEQMENIRAAREQSAWTQMAAGGFEYRLTPDRTDGYGGYFSPPAWLNELFATANRPGRVLAGLMVRFALPLGVGSINVPIISTGTAVQPATDDTPVEDQDFTDSEATSQVVAFGGQADVALQLLEQSPPGAHLDWAVFMDLTEAYDNDLGAELLAGTDGKTTGFLGVTNVTGINKVTYTAGSPTGRAMWPYLGQLPAAVGKERKRPPECWLMTTSRWAWLQSSEDSGERPFGLSTRFFLGSDDATPDPISGLMGWPVFLDDAIATNQGASAKQDVVVCLRPRDMMLLESQPQTLIAREPLSGSLGVRLQMHANVAALTGRRPAGIAVLGGTGMTVQSGY